MWSSVYFQPPSGEVEYVQWFCKGKRFPRKVCESHSDEEHVDFTGDSFARSMVSPNFSLYGYTKRDLGIFAKEVLVNKSLDPIITLYRSFLLKRSETTIIYSFFCISYL